MIKQIQFQTIQFSISHLFALSLNVKRSYLTFQVLPLLAIVDLGAMAMKEYTIFPRAPLTGGLQSDCLVSYPGHLFVGGVLSLCRDAVCVFYSSSWMGKVCFGSVNGTSWVKSLDSREQPLLHIYIYIHISPCALSFYLSLSLSLSLSIYIYIYIYIYILCALFSLSLSLSLSLYIYLYIYIYIYIYTYSPDIGLMVRVFANGPVGLGSIPGLIIPKTQKMVLDAAKLISKIQFLL